MQHIRTVVLQFAARLGKTAIGQALMISRLATKPAPALFGSSTEALAKQIVKLKLREMLRQTDATRPWLPKKTLQSRIELTTATIYVAWSGSPTTLADIDPDMLHANEVDKWTKDESSEADSLPLFLERGIERPDRKVIIESTPSITGTSRVNRFLVNGWDARWNVPCHFCSRYQVLEVNKSQDWSLGGLWWDREEGGKHPSPDKAYDTARYVCKFCHAEIDNQYRRPMIRRGVWVPKGQRAIKGGRVIGKRFNDGPVASFQLSRIYAPTFTFGDMARAFIESRGDLGHEQNYANSWEGDVWNPRTQYAKWEDVSARLCLEYELGELPEDTVFLTAGVDVQQDHLVFVIVAWCRDQVGKVITYGIADSWSVLFSELDSLFSHPVAKSMKVVFVGIDSRHRPVEVKDQCTLRNTKNRRVWPIEGHRSQTLAGRPYTLSPVDHTKSKEVQLIKVNTGFWQMWIDNCLYRRMPGDTNSLCAPKDSRFDEDFWEQLTNESRNEKGDWEPIHVHMPWDFRDCVRYARVVAEVYVKSQWQRLRTPVKPRPTKPASEKKELVGVAPQEVESSSRPQRPWSVRTLTRRR
jgi:phage terminase large subunit GpA-like protein